MKKILIYGTGKVADYYFEHHDFEQQEIVIGFVETEKKNDQFKSKKVWQVNEISGFEWDEIHIACSYIEVLFELEKQNVPKNKIVLCNQMLKEKYEEYKKYVDLDLAYNKEDAEAYERTLKMNDSYVLLHKMNRSLDKIGNQRVYFDIRMTDDYCRYTTLLLLSELVKENGLRGDLAELGVYKGDFARIMNALFPEKKLYLFDTFEGFDERDITYDLRCGYTSGEWFDDSQCFKDGSLEMTMNQMKYPQNCIVRQGLFPETIPDEKCTFSLVSLDCDLYQPIFEGLKYFYPLMEKGGYIMIHDYNYGDEMLGVKQAIKDYENEYGFIPKVPISDEFGTIVLCKS